MSILSNRFVADGLARMIGGAASLAMRARPLFPDIEGHSSEITVPTRHGPMPAILYRPPAGTRSPGVYVNAHGGGFVAGHPVGDDPLCRFLAARAGVFVLNVDYALAPGKRFPVPCEQVHDALKWASAEWPGARLCVGGQSAGGSLAAAASRLALRAGDPAIALQVLHYPPTDLVTPTIDKPVPAGRSVVIKPWMGEVFDTAYIPDPRRRRDPLASPSWDADGEDLEGIAPALVLTCEYDRLRAEASVYAERLAEAGALVEHYDIRGVDHGYDMMGGPPELVERVYTFLALHVERAVAG